VLSFSIKKYTNVNFDEDTIAVNRVEYYSYGLNAPLDVSPMYVLNLFCVVSFNDDITVTDVFHRKKCR